MHVSIFASNYDAIAHLRQRDTPNTYGIAALERAQRSKEVLLFTCGGGLAGEIVGSFHGLELGQSTLGVAGIVRVLTEEGLL